MPRSQNSWSCLNSSSPQFLKRVFNVKGGTRGVSCSSIEERQNSSRFCYRQLIQVAPCCYAMTTQNNTAEGALLHNLLCETLYTVYSCRGGPSIITIYSLVLWCYTAVCQSLAENGEAYLIQFETTRPSPVTSRLTLPGGHSNCLEFLNSS